jgi:spore coat protein H
VPRWPALQTQVEHFEISFDEKTWRLITDPSTAREYAPGRFKARGVEYEVGVRLRGDQARFHPKLSWKVKLPEGMKIDGMRRFNFLAEWLDAGYLTDAFSYELMHGSGAHSPRARYVLLTVNGKYEGIFVLVEQVDKPFLKAHGLDSEGSVYRCGERDCELKITPPAHYQKPWDKKTNEEQPSDELHTFLWKLSRTPEHELEGFLRQHMELDAYLRYMAVSALISLGGIDDSGSYLVHDPRLGKWLYVPWDLNNTPMQLRRTDPVGTSPWVNRDIASFTFYDAIMVKTYEHKQQKYGGAHMPFSVLSQRIWDCPPLRNQALDYLEELLGTVFTPEEAARRIDGQYALIRELLPGDPYVQLPVASYAPEFLKQYVARRRNFLAQRIPLERHRGEGGVVINGFGVLQGTAVGANGELAGYIDLYNREDTPARVGGMTFTDSLRNQFKHRLPAGLEVPPRGTLRLYADGQPGAGPTHLPFKLQSRGGELGLFDGKSMTGVVDLTFYAPLAPGKAYGRTPDGAERWNWGDAP